MKSRNKNGEQLTEIQKRFVVATREMRTKFEELNDNIKISTNSFTSAAATFFDRKRALIEQKYGVFSVFLPSWWKWRKISKQANLYKNKK